jgi:hypothetical protein
MTTPVEAVFVGKERRFNRRFERMCSHYLVEPVACTPAAGWEKGQVDNQVGVARERFFSPRLRVKSYAERSLCKSLSDFDFAASPVNKALIRDLHDGGFLAEQRNAVLVGGTGSGQGSPADAARYTPESV